MTGDEISETCRKNGEIGKTYLHYFAQIPQVKRPLQKKVEFR
jgi:hypothetical protein